MDRISTLTLETKITDAPASHLRRAYEAHRTLFQAQLQAVQRFLESQSLALARAITQDAGQVKFYLPDQVICDGSKPDEFILIPTDQREHKVGGLSGSMRRPALESAVSERLATLEAAQDQGVATGAALLRYTTATIMVRSLLPSGRSVRYQPNPGEEIPNQPVVDVSADGRRLNPMGEDAAGPEANELAAPYVPDARRFYLPQWVAFDDQGQLLVNTINDARAHIASMQEFLAILHAASRLAPYILADSEYQQKRYGIMGQLVNQGRALARFETEEIIQSIQRRVRNQTLNRGLSLSLPYFDDQDMELKNLDFMVIPAGRIMFVPAFLVLAVSAEVIKVAHNDWMSASTRQHLLAELKSLEKSFDSSK
jgi:hypothetical protein